MLKSVNFTVNFDGVQGIKEFQEGISECIKNNIEPIDLPKRTTFKSSNSQCNIFERTMDMKGNKGITYMNQQDKDAFYELLDEYMNDYIGRILDTLRDM